MEEYSISSWIVRDIRPFESAAELLAESGFKKIELSGTGSVLFEDWQKDCRGTTKKLEDLELEISSIHCPGGARSDLASTDDSAREKSLEINISFFEKMRDCGITEYVLHPGEGYTESPAKEEQNKKSILYLAEHAGKNGIRLEIENTLAKPCPRATVGELAELIRGTGAHVGLCLDIGHSARAGLDPLDEVCGGLDSGRLFSLHLHDLNSEKTDHFPPGEGILDMARIIEELDSRGFSGSRIVEIRPCEEAEEAARRLRAAACFLRN